MKTYYYACLTSSKPISLTCQGAVDADSDLVALSLIFAKEKS